MSRLLYNLNQEVTPRPHTDREKILGLAPDKVYDDGRTKQSHKDETDIVKIMARFEKTGTMSHINEFQGEYVDYSDYDFPEELRKLTRGREMFDALPAEVRREFGQSPQAFFAYVNDPANKDDLLEKLPDLAAPGTQLPKSQIEPVVVPPEIIATPEPDPAPAPIPTPDPPA